MTVGASARVGPPSPDADIPTPRRRLTRRRIVGGLVVIAFLGVFVASWHVVGDILDCSPPSQAELDAQRAFVQDHLDDAGNFDLWAADCDDDGAGYVDFTTGRQPARAQAAFLADESCSPHSDKHSDDIAVMCRSNGVDVYIFFEPNDDSETTSGALFMG